MATFKVLYTARNYPTNTDGLAVGLRVVRDDEYFQFFLPRIEGPYLHALSDDGDNAKWWSAFVEIGCREVFSRITVDQFKPGPDPMQALIIPVMPQQVQQHLDAGGGTTELIDGLWGGHLVHEFDGP